MLYSFQCILNDRDYYEFNKYHITKGPFSRKGRLAGILCVPVIFAIGLLWFVICGFEWYLIVVAALRFALISLIWIVAYLPLSLFWIRLHTALAKRIGKLPYTERATMEFYDSYFVEITENTRTEAGYNGLVAVCVNDGKGVYLYQNTILAYIVPFNAFESAIEKEEFIEFIKGKQPERR